MMPKTFETAAGIVHISFAGPLYIMPLPDGRTQLFEMHNYFGPIPCRKDGEPSQRTKKGFYKSFYLWLSGGKKVEGNLCILAIDPAQTGHSA